jgi:hypothetical protein
MQNDRDRILGDFIAAPAPRSTHYDTWTEAIDQSLYHWEMFKDPRHHEFVFFQKPRGVSESVTGKLLTNMHVANHLPNPQSFLIKAIKFEASGVEAVVKAMLRAGTIELIVGSKLYHVGAPLHEYALPDGQNLDPKICIPRLQNFGVWVRFDSGSWCSELHPNDTEQPIWMGVRLIGELYRPMQ